MTAAYPDRLGILWKSISWDATVVSRFEDIVLVLGIYKSARSKQRGWHDLVSSRVEGGVRKPVSEHPCALVKLLCCQDFVRQSAERQIKKVCKLRVLQLVRLGLAWGLAFPRSGLAVIRRYL